MAADDLPPLRDVIARYDLRAKKSLGQNFLLDLNLTRRIARAAGDLRVSNVYEVGPGPGGLTRALLMEGAAHVIALERDPRCVEALHELAKHYPGRLTLISGDALEVEETDILPQGPVKLVANLPYNLGTALLVKWLSVDWPPWWQSLTLMFQKEVAARIIAKPGSKAYGRLSVLAGWRSTAKLCFDVPARAFTPPPQVTSTVIHITPTSPIADISIAALERVTAAAFGQRRKMLRSALRVLEVDAERLLREADINPTSRAEDIDIAGFCRLAQVYESVTPGVLKAER